ncbi:MULTISPECIES: thiamine pyrophosphate-dependent dehydrogenase E1 component subunit alpha [unclassified Haladaptatus]|uniref:thiamine pyrophosphate-dependent dehydrogenase E1 component subunit alpha n=1 Tax=unclassified Haladaptatus TaxID=2622732 RepID=UPI00209BF974|nr:MULTISPECIES: thiamine pyrophosphate-dependent dehydrogenase E1 component subunit alpha [unclassified Haladaptatus]MCO8243760.1 thiamine pyrophosphate-dependent dehydrogenase E1 component subunit alpha [Haladaptatus sp. AB643]MCO8256701.1 thiamine pyrophosphate-dependent dehydrogenase E1 component subunit alpha [Haladaptatus sp. AB618]
MANDSSATVSTGPNRGRVSQEDLDVGRFRILAPDGSYDSDEVPSLDDEAFCDLYRWMLVERTFDERMVKLQRRGQVGTFGSGRGQEASIIGSGYALERDDWLLGMGREAGAMLLQGLPMRDLILFWRGVADANRELAKHDQMIAISIGGHLPVVTGAAWGMKLSDSDSVVAAYFGDGASSTGAVHEAVNFAGVLDAPAVFFCQNNQYAISTPFEKQTNARSLAQRAVGYGIDGIRVDGNDVLAVYEAVSEARDAARNGNPTLVESVTYRLDAHTTSDDPSRYRDQSEVDQWEERDPLTRYESFLRSEGLWGDIDREALVDDIDDEFDAALAAADEYEERSVREMFEYLYAELPPSLRRQLAEFEAFLEARPDADDHIEQRPKG